MRPSLKQVLDEAPPNAANLTLRCPLCSAVAPSRGLMPRRTHLGERWELAFICPSCGLYTTFALDHLRPDQVRRIAGTPWAAKLRDPESGDSSPPEVNPTQRREHIATTFTACAVTWLILTGSLAPIDLLWGAVVCTGVTALTYRFVSFRGPGWMRRPEKWRAFAALAWEFIRQLVVQNITLSRRVFTPKMPIHPGIVAVPFYVRSDVEITILSSLVTLTPDTVLVDVDPQKGLMYIHWIDVKTTKPDEAHRTLIEPLEEKIRTWLE